MDCICRQIAANIKQHKIIKYLKQSMPIPSNKSTWLTFICHVLIELFYTLEMKYNSYQIWLVENVTTDLTVQQSLHKKMLQNNIYDIIITNIVYHYEKEFSHCCYSSIYLNNQVNINELIFVSQLIIFKTIQMTIMLYMIFLKHFFVQELVLH